MSFMMNRIKGLEKFPPPNQIQQNKIEKEIMKDPTKFWESDVGQSIYNDKFNLEQ